MATAFAANIATRTKLRGDRWLLTGTITNDTGTQAAGGVAFDPVAGLGLTTLDRLLLGPSSVILNRSFWIKSTGKIQQFIESTGTELDVGAAAATASTYPFIAIGHKAE